MHCHTPRWNLSLRVEIHTITQPDKSVDFWSQSCVWEHIKAPESPTSWQDFKDYPSEEILTA